jgi:hypothetical protein
MKKLIINVSICVAFLFLSQRAFTQTTSISVIDSTASTAPRLTFGCGFGLNFLGGTNITLSPNLMYAVSDKFSLGAGIQGSYISIKDVQTTTTIGLNVVGEYNLSKKLTTLVEFAELKVHTKQETLAGDIKNDFWESALFVGAGYNINDKISLGAKFNLLYDEDESVYASPIIPFVNITF